MMTLSSHKQNRGFTFVEMIVVIVISGILATVVAQLIQRPIEAYQSMSRRASLVDKAESALLRLDREIRTALPNSIRISGTGRGIEFLRTQTGGRYRVGPTGDMLSFNPADADTSFEILGPLSDSGSIDPGVNTNDCRNNQSACLVIYNTGLAGSNAYQMENAATITSVTATPPQIVNFLNGGFINPAFPFESPDQIFYVVDTPISFLCDLEDGEIWRYQKYAITPSHSNVDTRDKLEALTPPAEGALLVDDITDCRFSYSAGTDTRNGLVKLEIELQEASETITLLQQVHIVNLP